MPQKKSKFSYDGPVTTFGKLIAERWAATTWAPTEKRALANLSYRFKTEYNLSPGTRIELLDECLSEKTAVDDSYHQITIDEYMESQNGL